MQVLRGGIAGEVRNRRDIKKAVLATMMTTPSKIGFERTHFLCNPVFRAALKALLVIIDEYPNLTSTACILFLRVASAFTLRCAVVG